MDRQNTINMRYWPSTVVVVKMIASCLLASHNASISY